MRNKEYQRSNSELTKQNLELIEDNVKQQQAYSQLQEESRNEINQIKASIEFLTRSYSLNSSLVERAVKGSTFSAIN